MLQINHQKLFSFSMILMLFVSSETFAVDRSWDEFEYTTWKQKDYEIGAKYVEWNAADIRNLKLITSPLRLSV